jgi:hypothetical protein
MKQLQPDSLLDSLGIDSLAIQDSVTSAVLEYLKAKHIDASVYGIRWGRLTIQANQHNAALLCYERDSLLKIIRDNSKNKITEIRIKIGDL